jgi:hypothetical protein
VQGVRLGWPGGGLLSRALRHSTIGARVFDGRVRDGIGSGHVAEATRPAKPVRSLERTHGPTVGSGLMQRTSEASWFLVLLRIMRQGDDAYVCDHTTWCAPLARQHGLMRPIKIERAISTGQLHGLLHFHIRPIDVVVFHGSSGRTRFEVGFPLRCLQRLSRPFIATLHCGWRHNSSTRGTFVPVLSY